jgi:site-specific DNA-methyltransferase (adenine-specific)
MRPRIQICTVSDLLDDKKPNLPPVYDIVATVAAARRIAKPPRMPTPEEIRESPSFKLPISGGRQKSAQRDLPIEEPLLVQPQERSRRGKRRSA